MIQSLICLPIFAPLFSTFNSNLPEEWQFPEALCINQKDLNGRATQVSLTGRINSSANVVIMWLVEDTSDLDNPSLLADTLATSFPPFLDRLSFLILASHAQTEHLPPSMLLLHRRCLRAPALPCHGFG